MCGQSVEETELILQHLQTAAESTDYRAVQVRRVRGHFSGLGRGGEWVGAIESVMHRGAAAGREEQFSLELRGFEGVALSVPELAQRQVLYQSRAAYLFRYQSFRVLDARAAAQQYVVVALGEGAVRAGRYCNRIAVVSRTPDRPSWLLDLDAALGVPLYAGEFTPNGALVAELEVGQISFGSAAHLPDGTNWGWTPRMGVEEFASAAQARARARTIVSIDIAPADLGGRYVFDHARVVTDPLTGEQSLVHVFHDGIDAIFVSQRAREPLHTKTHTIRLYDEAGVHQCLFQQGGTEFLLVGRNTKLKDIATRLYRRAAASL
ncbi:MAG TPA: hypothetical protein VK081_01050 [Planctomycetota bacterium]|nr:hypothetical protein [Planctomycetota bacterium]